MLLSQGKEVADERHAENGFMKGELFNKWYTSFDARDVAATNSKSKLWFCTTLPSVEKQQYIY